MEFVVPVDHRVKIYESEKRDKYLDLARELRKLLNIRVTVIPIWIGALGAVLKDLEKGQEELEIGRRIKTIQTMALLRSARIP